MTASGAQASLELAVDACATTGEGPVWDPARRVLWWVDIPAGRVHRFDPASGADRTLDVGASVGAVALRSDGTLLAALADRLAALDPDEGRLETLLSFTVERRPLRCNDGKCDPAGRFWIGRMDPAEAPGAGSLLRIGADLAPATVLDGLTIPNGLGWSLDRRTMYYVDSAWGEVRAFPFDPADGSIGEGRSLARVEGGLPDGLTVDAEGCLWVAVWGAGRVIRLSPDGVPVERIGLPVSQVSSCTFGGEDLADLFITSAREGLGQAALAREPLAGGLFRCRPGVRGLPPVAFAG